MLNNQITKAVNNALNNNIMVEDEKKRANNEAYVYSSINSFT